MTWTQKDLDNLKVKGYKIDDSYSPEIGGVKKSKIKIVKISIEKQTIELFLKQFKEQGLIYDYVTELQFDEVRKFRFDWAIPSLKIALEYEGIFSEKSRHTTITGYSKDIEKYNLAITLGWRVLRYTAKNYKDLENDLKKLLWK
jgi:hypothetical protein